MWIDGRVHVGQQQATDDKPPGSPGQTVRTKWRSEPWSQPGQPCMVIDYAKPRYPWGPEKSCTVNVKQFEK